MFKKLLLSGAVLMLASAMTAHADTLYGFCWGGSTCSDNGTNTPTTTNPPQFGFHGSGTDSTGDFVIVFLIPDSVSPASSIGVTGTVPGTAGLFSSTAWTSGDLAAYLGFNASSANPISAFGAGGASGYYVYDVDFGNQLVGGNADPGVGLEETTAAALPDDSYIVGFLSTPTRGTQGVFSATADDGAILVEAASTSTTPEPSPLMLMGTGALGMAGLLRRRFRRG